MFLLVCLTTFVFPANAQIQERKLADRLMEPDMSLANSAQNKKFVAVGGTSVDKKFEAKSFVDGHEATTKSFGGSKSFLSKIFGTNKYARTDAAANANTNAEMAYANAKFATHESSLVRQSPASEKQSKVKDYPDQRPFLAKGTRQEILSQQDKPLTIDEVRELLNRNK
jgi:hypothetical protein